MKKMFDLSYFIGKSYFNDDKIPNYLVFQPVFEFFQTFSGAVVDVLGWKRVARSQLLLHQTIVSSKTYLYS